MTKDVFFGTVLVVTNPVEGRGGGGGGLKERGSYSEIVAFKGEGGA